MMTDPRVETREMATLGTRVAAVNSPTGRLPARKPSSTLSRYTYMLAAKVDTERMAMDRKCLSRLRGGLGERVANLPAARNPARPLPLFANTPMAATQRMSSLSRTRRKSKARDKVLKARFRHAMKR